MNPNTHPLLVRALHKILCCIALPILLASCGGGDSSNTSLTTPDLVGASDQGHETKQTNIAGSDTTTVNFEPVNISNVQLTSSGNQATPQVADVLTLEFETTGQTSFAPQVSIGGQRADVALGSTAGQWMATLTVDANFQADDQGFTVIVVVPDGASPTEDLRQGVMVRAVSGTPLPLDLENTTASPLTPILVLETTSYSFAVNHLIIPITLTNLGGEVQIAGCSIDPALPAGLSLATSATGTCQITGTPTLVTLPTTYTITAINATGADEATITIEVNAALDAPDLANITETQSFTVGQAITPITFSNTGGSVTAGGCVVSSYQGGRVILLGGLDVVVVNGACQITGTPTLVTLPTTYTITAINATGADEATITIEVNAALDAPDLANITETQSFTVGQAITPITFSNTGGSVTAGGCVVSSYQGGRVILLGGLDVVVVNGTCQITGTPTFAIFSTTHTITAINVVGADEATITIEVNAALNTPDLANITETQSLTVGQAITPITFTNTGGDVATGGCVVSSGQGGRVALPSGLDVAAVNGTCQITGTPTLVVAPSEYIITAINSAGTATATATIAVVKIEDGTVASPYIILTVEQLQAIGAPDPAESLTHRLSSHYRLGQNIDLSGIENWQPIGTSSYNAFTGSFDGDGYTISGLNSSNHQFAGLFGFARDANISNLEVLVGSVSAFNSDSEPGSNAFAGGLAGFVTNSQISNSYVFVTGNVSSISALHSSYTGGLVGYARFSQISNSYADVAGDISAAFTCIWSLAGGLVGLIEGGSVRNSYAVVAGDVSASSILDSSSAGGLVGFTASGQIRNSYSVITGDISSLSAYSSFYAHAGGLVGATLDDRFISNSYYSASRKASEGAFDNTLGTSQTVAQLRALATATTTGIGWTAFYDASADHAVITDESVAFVAGDRYVWHFGDDQQLPILNPSPVVADADLSLYRARQHFVVTVSSATQVNLSWSDAGEIYPGEAYSHYRVHRHTVNDTSGSTLIGFYPDDRTYTDTGLVTGTTYYYWLKACDPSGRCSDFFTHARQATPVAPVILSNDALSFPQSAVRVVIGDVPNTFPVATTSSGTGVIIYTSDTPNVATVDLSSGQVTIVSAGVAIITAMRVSDVDYIEATASYTLTVVKGTDALTFPQSTVRIVISDAPNTLQIAMTRSGTGVITYVSDTPNVATVDSSSGQVTIVGAGETIITATRAEDNNYVVATASYTLTVVKGTDAPTFLQSIVRVVIGDIPSTFPVATTSSGTGVITYASSVLNVATVDSSSGQVTIVGAGETIITATRAEDDNYREVSTSYTLIVVKGTEALNFPLSTVRATVGDAPSIPQIATTRSGTGVITYASDTPSVATVDPNSGQLTIVSAGETTITATRAEDDNYREVSASYTLTVVGSTLIRTLADLNDVRDNLAGDYMLAANIDLSSVENWQPIGDSFYNAFTGSFDGDGYTISGLNSSNHQFAGLFGFTRNANISNLEVLVGNISAFNSDSEPGSNAFAGGLVGFVTNSQISNSYVFVTGNVSSTSAVYSSYTGGLVGYAQVSQISNSYADVAGDISSTLTCIWSLSGGLVGLIEGGSIRNSYSVVAGSVLSSSILDSSSAGGLVGFTVSGQVRNSYAVVTGHISSTSAHSNSYAGGLTGGTLNEGFISNSYYSADRESSEGVFSNTLGTPQTVAQLRALTATTTTDWTAFYDASADHTVITDESASFATGDRYVWHFGDSAQLPSLNSSSVVADADLALHRARQHFVVTVSSATQVSLSWSDAGDIYPGEAYSHYRVHRHTVNDTSGSTLLGISQPENGRTYTDTGLTTGTTYYYWLKACDPSGRCSDFFTHARQATPATPVILSNDALSFPQSTVRVVIGDAPNTFPIATTRSGTGVITYASDTPSVATVDSSSGQLTIVGAGEAIITATRAEDNNYRDTTASYTLTVAKGTDALTFLQSTLRVVISDAPSALQIATTRSGTGSITYASDTPNVATVDSSSGQLTIISAGVAIITATRAEDNNYVVATANYTLTVAKGTDALSFPLSTVRIVIGDVPNTFPIATTSSGAGIIIYASDTLSVATVDSSSGQLTIVGAGVAIITATRVEDNNYVATTANYALTVAKGTDALSFPLSTVRATVGDSPSALQIATTRSGTGTITYASDTPNVATVDSSSGQLTIVGAGEAIITATRAEDANYLEATASYTLTVVGPTLIRTLADLNDVRDNLAGDYILGANIDLSSVENWQPIGDSYDNAFRGSFDGDGYTISGLNSSNHQSVGLFGFARNANINNLGVLAGNISAFTSDSIPDSDSYAGGLVGYAINIQISNSYAVVAGNISSTSAVYSSYAGGLVGYVYGSQISNSYADVAGDISSVLSCILSYTGGLVGHAEGGSVRNSYAVVRGDISSSSILDFSYAGGLVGFASSRILIGNSYAEIKGDISAAAIYSRAGGLVGMIHGGGVGQFQASQISNSYAVVEGSVLSIASSDISYAGGLAGYVSDSSISNSYAAVLSDISSTPHSSAFAGGLIGLAEDNSPIRDSYYSANRKTSEGAFDNALGTAQTVAQLRALTDTSTDWAAFYDADADYAVINDDSASFATGDRYVWYFGDDLQLPILNPSLADVADANLSLYRARQHFVAIVSSATQISLSWSDVGNAYTYYEVYRHTVNDSSGATWIASPLAVTGRTYLDTSLTTGATYYYWLRACGGVNNECSDFFTHMQRATPDVPATPTVVKGTDTLSFPQSTVRVFIGDTPNTSPVASGGSGTGAITYASDTPSVATVDSSSGQLTIVGVGETLITATRAEDDNHLEATASYTLTVVGSMLIRTLADLDDVRNNLAGDYMLAANIDLSSIENWRPIGGSFYNAFTGSFDGDGYTISGLNSSDHRFTGLFGFVRNANISNLEVLVGSMSAFAFARDSFAGGLVGFAASSQISNSYVFVTGNVSSTSTLYSSYAGGLAGYTRASQISNSYADVAGDISSILTCIWSLSGGLVGLIEGGSIRNSYSVVAGSVLSSSILDSSSAGGLVGYVISGQISNAYAVVRGDISSTSSYSDSYAGGLVGGTADDSSIANSYYSANRKSSERASTNTLGTSQTVAQLRALTATTTGWTAFYDASAGYAVITDESASFAAGDRYVWYFGNDQQLPTLTPSLAIEVITALNVNAPALANVADQSLTVGQAILPITFVNTGGDVATSGCVVSSGQGGRVALPRGLDVVVANGTCQITGIPTLATVPSEYTITATNSAGIATATITISVVNIGDGTAANPYIIFTVEQLQAIGAPDPVESLGESLTSRLSSHYRLGRNLDLSSIENWQPIGASFYDPFTGSFDGDGHTISGLNSSNHQASGLFGFAHHATIKNIGILAGNISSTSGVDITYSGGLVGKLWDSLLSNSYAIVTGDISSTSPYANAGGLVGQAEWGSISNSYAVVKGNVFITPVYPDPLLDPLPPFPSIVTPPGTYATSPTRSGISSISSDPVFAGGLVGFADDVLISNSYAVVYAGLGSLVGHTWYGSISNSYYSATPETSEGVFDATFGTPQTIAQLHALTATTAGWTAFYDAEADYAVITDESATFTTGDRRVWYFGDDQQLPILNPSPAGIADADLSLQRARQHFGATANSATQVSLSWSDVGNAYTYYEVYRHTAYDSSGAVRIATPLVVNSRTYLDTSLTTGTTYYYWLKACGSVSNECSDFFAHTQVSTPQ